MSFSIVEHIHAQYPVLLTQNSEASNYQFVVHVIAALRAHHYQAYHVCKTAGEGQYVPPGFQPRTVIGLDGKGYTCTGVSYDAIWSEGAIFDVIGGAANHPIPGRPAWNIIPQEHWRPNNPPLLVDNIPVVPKPDPKPPVTDAYPGDEVFDQIGVALFADYGLAGQPPNPQMGRWIGRIVWDWLAKNEQTIEGSVTKHRASWRTILGLPPL